MRKETKRLTYSQYDRIEDKLRDEGWKVVEVKSDVGVVILEKR